MPSSTTTPAASISALELFSAFPHRLSGSPAALEQIEVIELALDSRRAKAGTVFFALPGEKSDGASFIPAAEKNGAVAAVAALSSADLIKTLGVKIPVALTADPREAMSAAADIFYGTSLAAPDLVGVTGTNGKTSVAWIISEALAQLGTGSAYIGTLGQRTLRPGGGELRFEPALQTTPESIELHAAIARAGSEGAARFTIEISSHGIAQSRVSHLRFQAAVFTNLTRDHLDFHKTFEAYGQTKLRLFTELLLPGGIAVINIDDSFGAAMADRLTAQYPDRRLIRTSRNAGAEAEVVQTDAVIGRHGTVIQAAIQGRPVKISSALVGDYNISNLLSAAAALSGLGYTNDQISAALERVRPVPGRLELAAETHPAVFVDYAHTPDGLINALNSVRKLRQSEADTSRGKIITVFGCGGNRDRGKRPLMGRAVADLSDLLIVTSDNPRFEEPEQIIEDILPGIPAAEPAYEVFVDRRAAIHHAIQIAKAEDIVLVAGKGHETYQEIRGERQPFSDVEVCREALQAAGRI